MVTQVINQTKNTKLIAVGTIANSFWLRLKGLLGKSSLLENEGLILVGVKSVHTFFMRIPIDVVYVDKDYQVIRIDENMLPNRIGPYLHKSAYIVELSAFGAKHASTEVGDQLKFEI